MTKTLYALFLSICLISCTNDIIEKDTTHLNIFQSFWQIMDERYVFFEEKRLNWDSIYTVWHPKFEKIHSDIEAVAAFDTILNCIGDGHLSINSASNKYVNPFWRNRSLYLCFGKIYYTYSFSNIIYYSNLNLAQMPNSMTYLRILENLEQQYIISGENIGLQNYNYSNGLIVDLRDCPGGYDTGYGICDLFFTGKKTIYYTQTKQGKEHTNFTNIKPVALEGFGLVDKRTPIMLLINNNTYSMGNSLAFIIKDLTNCTVIGEQSGGGGGSVIRSYLPAGWGLGYTNTRDYDLSKHLMENGLKPDIEVIRSKEFWEKVHPVKGEDPQLEKAIEVLNN
jgi:hypothetical protein